MFLCLGLPVDASVGCLLCRAKAGSQYPATPLQWPKELLTQRKENVCVNLAFQYPIIYFSCFSNMHHFVLSLKEEFKLKSQLTLAASAVSMVLSLTK